MAPPRAVAWNSTGHRIIAWIAYEELDRNARSSVDRLLRQHPSFDIWRKGLSGKPGDLEFDRGIFVRASTWPDEIRSTDPSLAHSEWHFIALGFSPDQTPVPEPSKPNIVEQIGRIRRELGNKEISKVEQAFDLVWLIHLVGDVHQPLHCTTRFTSTYPPPLGDLGGNLFKISDKGVTTSLHAYWDSLLGTSSSSLNSSRSSALLIMKKYKPDESEELSEEIWAQESFKLGQSVAYKITAPESSIFSKAARLRFQPHHYFQDAPSGRLAKALPKVSTAYAANAKKTASIQAVTAGVRLAMLLENIFNQ